MKNDPISTLFFYLLSFSLAVAPCRHSAQFHKAFSFHIECVDACWHVVCIYQHQIIMALCSTLFIFILTNIHPFWAGPFVQNTSFKMHRGMPRFLSSSRGLGYLRCNLIFTSDELLPHGKKGNKTLSGETIRTKWCIENTTLA